MLLTCPIVCLSFFIFYSIFFCSSSFCLLRNPLFFTSCSLSFFSSSLFLDPEQFSIGPQYLLHHLILSQVHADPVPRGGEARTLITIAGVLHVSGIKMVKIHKRKGKYTQNSEGNFLQLFTELFNS